MPNNVRLRGEMTWDNSRLRRGLKQGEDMIRKSSRTIGKIRSGLIAGAAAFGAFRFGSDVRRTAEEFDVLSKRLGVTTDEIQRLGFIATQNKSSLEKIFDALFKFNRIAARPNDEQRKVFAELGIDLEKIRKMNPERQLFELADAFQNVGDRGRAVALFYKIFEESARQVVPVLEQQREALEALAKAAPIIDKKDIDKFADLQDKVGGVNAGMDALNLKAANIGTRMALEAKRGVVGFAALGKAIKNMALTMSPELFGETLKEELGLFTDQAFDIQSANKKIRDDMDAVAKHRAARDAARNARTRGGALPNVRAVRPSTEFRGLERMIGLQFRRPGDRVGVAGQHDFLDRSEGREFDPVFGFHRREDRNLGENSIRARQMFPAAAGEVIVTSKKQLDELKAMRTAMEKMVDEVEEE